jgi:predicted glutamine amidotransferase
MCGIYGWQFTDDCDLPDYRTTVIATLLARSMESRGQESFGAAVWSSRDQVEPTIIKDTGSIMTYGDTVFAAATGARRVIVHTRQSTHGKITPDNSHPFLVGDVLGVHNGIVYNHDTLNACYNRSFEVDSQHIFAHINDQLPLDDLDGYGTVVYSRLSEGHTNVYTGRSTGGALFVARLYAESVNVKDRKHIGIIWASTGMAVRDAVCAAGLYCAEVSTPSEKVFVIDRNDIYITPHTFELRSVGKAQDPRTSGGRWAYGNSYVVGSSSKSTTSTPTVSSTPHPRLSRRERKRIRRQQRLLAGTTDGATADSVESDTTSPSVVRVHAAPTLDNYRLLSEIKRGTFIYTGSEQTLMCATCQCSIVNHNAQLCTTCTVPDACENGVPAHIPLCFVCDCWLMEGVHDFDGTGEMWCEACGVGCSAEWLDELSVGSDNDSDNDDVEEFQSRLESTGSSIMDPDDPDDEWTSDFDLRRDTEREIDAVVKIAQRME